MNQSSVPLFANSFVSTSRIIYTPSTFARTNLIHLQEVGTLTARAPHTSRRKGLQSYLFFIVLDGSGSMTYDGVTYQLHEGDCVFIDCRKEYSHCSSEDLWTLAWAHFYGPTMSAIYDKYLDRGGKRAFQCNRVEEYRELLQDVFDTAAAESYVRDVRLSEKLTSLIAVLMEDAWNPGEKSIQLGQKRLSVVEIKRYIDENYKEKLTLEMLANKFYIHKSYLARIFKDEYGVTVTAYICQVRITKAKSLLRFTQMAVEEIAYEVGFPDRNYFSRVFKRVEGTTPGQYRKTW